MTAWILLGVCYLWGGLTLLLALEQMEEIAGALNDLSGLLELKPIGQHIRGKFGVRAVVVALWPCWAFLWWKAAKKPNVEVNSRP
jgi:hypothetical protein